MLCLNTPACGFSERQPPLFGILAQEAQSAVSAGGNQHFTADLEERIETFPPVADDKDAASARFEQAHARRVAGALHGFPRDVEREALGAVETGVQARRQMNSTIDIGGPEDLLAQPFRRYS